MSILETLQLLSLIVDVITLCYIVFKSKNK